MLVPRLADSELIELGQNVLLLLKEIAECTEPCLKKYGLEQHAADLHKAADAVTNALEPLIAGGDVALWEALELDVPEE